MTKTPSPKTDNLRAMREQRFKQQKTQLASNLSKGERLELPISDPYTNLPEVKKQRLSGTPPRVKAAAQQVASDLQGAVDEIKPDTKAMMIRVPPALKKRIKQRALDEGVSIQDWVISAIEQELLAVAESDRA